MALAKTVFATGIDEALATIDVYGEDTASSELGVAFTSEDFDADSITGLVGGNLADPSELIAGFDDTSGLLLDSDALKNSLLAALQGGLAALAQMSPDMAFDVLNVKGSSQVYASTNGIESMISRADLSSLTGLAALISSISGSPFQVTLTDRSGLTALSTNVLRQAAVLGVPGAYTQFAGGMSSDLPMLTNITKGILPTVISSSNVDMLSEIANGPIASNVTALSPNIASSFVASFRLKPHASTTSVLQTSSQLMAALTTLDPSWNRTSSINTRFDSSQLHLTNNADAVLNASADFKKLASIAAAAKITPLAVRPTVVKNQTTATVPDPVLEFPEGTTSVATTNQDGSTTTIYTLPDGTVVTRVTRPDGIVTSTYKYAAQPAPAPVASSKTALFDAPAVNASYIPEGLEETNIRPLRVFSPAASVFNRPSYGVGSYGTISAVADGQDLTHIYTPDGSLYLSRRQANGDTQTTSIESTGGADFVINGDPFVNAAASVAADPLIMASIMNLILEQARQQEVATLKQSLLTMSAARALQTSFPLTNLTSIV